MSRTPWAQPCSAHRRDGWPCGAYAIRGGGVCRMHGGAAPQVRHAAQRRLFEECNRRHRERWERMKPETRAVIVAGLFTREDFSDYEPLPKGFGQGG